VTEAETRKAIVADLECDLGDIAAKRYRSSLEGLDVVRQQAAKWAMSVRDDAATAVASVAKSEVRFMLWFMFHVA
jgi:hypothetical protein